MGDGSDIVVKGGSVHVIFNSDSYRNEKEKDKKHHWDDGRKLTRICVYEYPGGPIVWDSKDTDVSKYEVRVSNEPK